MNPPGTALYLLALLPPEPVFTAVWTYKQEVAQLTGSRNAVRLPPHITLIPPCHLPVAGEAEVVGALAEFAAGQAAFPVGLRDFGWFGTRTLFVKVVDTEPVKGFHAALSSWCAARVPAIPREKRPFTPHMTLATRDLPADQVPALRQLFAGRRYAADFPVVSFRLYRHDGRKWQPAADFPLLTH
ncbi:2'-5' RNA ligase family protein [Hymenobacter sp. BT175]|uniref:2'-5' RNA ligase family protein n=1 Tax=Hymenobacter translucens TaxID=2886507 RepID=UPI001D0EBFDA|nr:2'-5' RNA ligase family protein [Hymenobacter translucens]MCC2544997.1 2'-5' RNA ligase family protein [Hymenobacter translucens]